MIVLPPLGALETELWRVLLDLREAHDGWTLIGGQMVFLLGLEHQAVPPRISADIDVVADIRAQPPRLPRVVAWLEECGFAVGEPDPDGYAHRFTRGRVVLDLLIPDGAGERVDRSSSDSSRTVPVAGGTYALKRSRDLEVVVDGCTGQIPCPDVLGALVVKSRAARVDHRRGPERHLRDLAFLYSMVDDPIQVREELGARNRGRLRAVEFLADPTHVAWTDLGERARDAFAAREIITSES